ncbi:MAG: hypothetical protein IT529_03055 [Burkholderiales bacterium]|nr:hypothetical protein [Burkholderiales bacterium]
MAAFAWWVFAADIVLGYAWKGWSVIDWMNHARLPENFARDFPSGISAYDKSAFLRIYPLAERWLGIAPEVMLRIVPAFELAAVAFAASALAWALAARHRAPVAAVVFLYVVASWGADLDLARFGMPYSYALYYYAAEASRLAAIAFAIRRSYAASALLLALGAITHPTMSLCASAFIVAMMVLSPREFLSRGALAGAALFCAIVLPWAWTQILFDPAVAAAAEQVPHRQWLEIMHAFNYHFFPVEFGVFTQADVRFLPLLSLAVLWCHYLTRVGLDPQTVRRLAAGMILMAALSVLGVVLSVVAPSPFIAKLSLHRASLLAVLVALPVVVAGLWRDLTGEAPVLRIAAAGTLVAPFLMDPGWPLVFTMVLTWTGWWPLVRGRRARAADGISAALLLVTIGLAVYYVGAGLVEARSHALRSNTVIWYAIAGFILASYALGRIAGPARGRGLAGLAVVAVSCSIWLALQATPEDRLRLYADYKAAQLWARENTPPASLFMADPGHHYGWRDFSQRSSFGTLHEWLFTTWVYTSDAARFREGYARFGELGIDLAPFLRQRPSVARGFEALTPVVRERYNSADDAWRLAIARKYGIDYFVIHKSHWRAQSALPVAFENASFFILRAEPAAAGR